MSHDLISFPGARISLTSIHGIEDDLDEAGLSTGTVIVNYGQGFRLAFEGDVQGVMEVIDAYCAAQAAQLAPGIMSQGEFREAVGI